MYWSNENEIGVPYLTVLPKVRDSIRRILPETPYSCMNEANAHGQLPPLALSVQTAGKKYVHHVSERFFKKTQRLLQDPPTRTVYSPSQVGSSL